VGHVVIEDLTLESGKSSPKARFSSRLPSGDYLQVAVWSGKSDPSAEVVSVQLRHLSDDEWTTVGKLALYRAKDGSYTQLPERQVPKPNPETDSKSSNAQQDQESIP
jgi:hypothetical protein